MFKPGRGVHPPNGIGVAPATVGGDVVSFDEGPNKNRQGTISILVSNLEIAGGNNLEISFSKGKGWVSIAPAQSITLPIAARSVLVRGTAGGVTAAYSIMGIV